MNEFDRGKRQPMAYRHISNVGSVKSTCYGHDAKSLMTFDSSFTPITNEFTPSQPPLLTLSQNIGLLFGAMFWGFGCDVFGRRWAFNLTLGVTAVWGMIAASAPNFAAIGCCKCRPLSNNPYPKSGIN